MNCDTPPIETRPSVGRFITQAAIVAIGLALLVVGFRALAADAASADGPTSFVAITPCRLADTRSEFQIGTRGAPLGDGEQARFQVTGAVGDCTIPKSAVAVSANVTAVGPTAATFIAVWPSDAADPGTSIINLLAGQSPTPNNVSVAMSEAGSITFLNAFGSVDLIVDVLGYYIPVDAATGVPVDVVARLDQLEDDVAAGEEERADLLARLATAEASLAVAEDDIVQLEQDVLFLSHDVEGVQSRLGTVESKTAPISVGNFTGGPTLRVSGVNLQVVDGSGDTGCGHEPGSSLGDDPCNGRGNVVIGYHEDPNRVTERTGSHNLDVGAWNSYTRYGGAVIGFANEIAAPYSSVTGGRRNTADDFWSTVGGGENNRASGNSSFAAGGSDNVASGNQSATFGGFLNQSTASYAYAFGGQHNDAAATSSTVIGGESNSATTVDSMIVGGHDNITGAQYAVVVGGWENQANGDSAVVVGGNGNTASGASATVTGGSGNTASGDASSISGGASDSVSGTFDWRAGDDFFSDD